jgi:hypothetical protein
MSDELYHYGVLGMRWGSRKALKNGHAGYTQYHQKEDFRALGNKGVRRINAHMQKGKTYTEASKSVYSRNMAVKTLRYTAVMVGLKYGPQIASTVANVSVKALSKMAASRTGKNAAAKMFGLGVSTIIKPTMSRSGSYKITNMK